MRAQSADCSTEYNDVCRTKCNNYLDRLQTFCSFLLELPIKLHGTDSNLLEKKYTNVSTPNPIPSQFLSLLASFYS